MRMWQRKGMVERLEKPTGSGRVDGHYKLGSSAIATRNRLNTKEKGIPRQS